MFNICGENWSLKLVSNNHPKILRLSGEPALASCDDETKTIYISQDVPPHMLKKVLCHEITHAAMFSHDVFMTLEQEELVADLMATYGAEILNITNQVFDDIT